MAKKRVNAMILYKKYSRFGIRLLVCVLFFTHLISSADSCLEKARGGDAEAQLELGNRYFYGDKETVKAYPLAINWYRKALKNGNLAAAFNLAICYDAGYGVERDLEQAKDFYLTAIKAGVKPALLNYALILQELHHPLEAQKYLKRAADAGIASAARLYALTLPPGAESHRYLIQASDQGDAEAMLKLADDSEKKGDLKKMAELLKGAADKGNVEAMVKMGFCYQTHYGVDQSYTKARAYYKAAAELGHPLGAVEFGKLLLKEQRPQLAYAYFSYACKMDNPIALFMKGVCLNTGVGTKKDQKAAFTLFERSAKLGYVKAQYNTGLAFEQGIGIDSSLTMAKYWYEEAIKQGDIQSYLSLAEFYFYGTAVTPMDQARAVRYLKEAEKRGSSEATQMLRIYTEAMKQCPK
jgi:TPR repeat protein